MHRYRHCFLWIFILISFTPGQQSERSYRSIEEIIDEWKNYTSFQKNELLNFCDFLFDEGYYERTILACFKYLFLFPNDELIPIVYYKIARSYEESGNRKLAMEYYKKVQSEVETNSLEYISANYRITYLHLINEDYSIVYEKTQNSDDPYLLVFKGYAKLSELKWSEAKDLFMQAHKQFKNIDYSDILMPLMDACEEASSLPRRDRTLAAIFSIIPGGGRIYFQDWIPFAGILATSTGLGLQLAFGSPSLLPKLIPALAITSTYALSIWGTIRDVDYANHQIFLKYAQEIKLKYGPENFLNFIEPEFLTLD